MTPEVAIMDRLVADPVVAALIVASGEERIYPSVLPQKPTLPALVIQRVSKGDSLSVDGAIGHQRIRVQIDIYSTDYGELGQVDDAVQDALHGKKWTTADVDDVQLVELDQSRDTAADADAAPGPGQKLYRRLADYIVTFRKAA